MFCSSMNFRPFIRCLTSPTFISELLIGRVRLFNHGQTDVLFQSGRVEDRGRFLHRCGMEVPEGNVFEFVEKTWEHNRVEFAEKRREVCSYTFGKPRKLSEINKNILENIGCLT